MEIKQNKNGNEMTIELVGRLDTTTAPQLDEVVRTQLNGIADLTFDFAALEYVSSAGLRVLLAAQKTMNKQGKMVIKNVCDDIKEVFEITGFSDILTIA